MKKYIYLAAIAALVSGLFSACEDKTDKMEDYASPLALDKESIAATAAAASYDVAVTAKGAWDAESDATWATVSPKSGNGDGKVTISVAAANDSVERKATISVSVGYVHKEVVVTQAAQKDTYLSLDRNAIDISYAAISYPVVVTSDGDWSVSADKDWVTVSPASGTGSGTFKIDVALNEGAARSAKVTVSWSGKTETETETVTVSQGAFEESISLSTNVLRCPAYASTRSFVITSNVEWTVTSSDAWCTVNPTSGVGRGTVTLTTQSYNSLATPRAANITVASTGGGVSEQIVLTQNDLTPKGWWLFDDPADLLKPAAGTTATLAYATGSNSHSSRPPGPFRILTAQAAIDSGFTAIAGPKSGDGAITVKKEWFLQCTHNIPIPNGLSTTKISEFTILWRLKYSASGWKALLQTDITNGGGGSGNNDGDWFINGMNFSGGVGAGTEAGGHQNRIVPDVWHNLLLSVNLGAGGDGTGAIKFYLNGNFISAGNYADANGRAGLYATFLFLADEDGETADMDVAELAIWEFALTADQAAEFQTIIASRP